MVSCTRKNTGGSSCGGKSSRWRWYRLELKIPAHMLLAEAAYGASPELSFARGLAASLERRQYRGLGGVFITQHVRSLKRLDLSILLLH